MSNPAPEPLSAERVRLQIVGGGKMGHALLAGMVAADWATLDELAVIELDPDQREHLASTYPGLLVGSEPLGGVDTMLAVKPHHTLTVAAQLVEPGRVVSIAAGITTAAIEAVVPSATPVIRVMPNTPALVNAGASAVAGGSAATAADVEWAVSMLGSVGTVVGVTEAQLDAVTGLSGSGPAYFFLIAEALADAGVNAGLPRATATVLANQTMAGAAKMLQETDQEPSALRAAVTTPSGTTAAGLRVLEQRGVRAAMIDAVAAASERSRELGTQ